jgi:hypothetical protein
MEDDLRFDGSEFLWATGVTRFESECRTRLLKDTAKVERCLIPDHLFEEKLRRFLCDLRLVFFISKDSAWAWAMGNGSGQDAVPLMDSRS